jgi:NAD(P)-dependent dehydrogenase (short-subunit alcohol dehydrogenase family)
MTEHQSSEPAQDSFLAKAFGLAGKTAVVTGGGGTLCGAMAKGFALAGANVVLWGRGQTSLDETVRRIAAAGAGPARVATVVVDLADESQIAAALRTSVTRFGRVDILLNGVGGSSIRRPLVEVDAREFAAVLELNLLAGCILPTKQVAQYWIEQRIRGAIINIASMGSYRPLSGGWAYSAAKAAVMNQTVAHARELAPHGIRVNALAPGFFLGKQNRRLLMAEDGTPTARGQAVLAHTPLGRFGDPDELIAAAVFLASDGAGFVSGVTLPVDGAFLCHGI